MVGSIIIVGHVSGTDCTTLAALSECGRGGVMVVSDAQNEIINNISFWDPYMLEMIPEPKEVYVGEWKEEYNRPVNSSERINNKALGKRMVRYHRRQPKDPY